MEKELELATIANGCFWCTEAVFQRLNGVASVMSGYAGGATEHPSYEQVSTGKTGHAEAIQITFDPEVISFETLLEVFFATHDPTTLNRQGSDVGPQYRSAIFYHSDEQKQIAEKVKEKSAANFDKPIVTEIVPFTNFFFAEDYHRNFYMNNSEHPYCQLIIDPKITKLLEKFPDQIR